MKLTGLIFLIALFIAPLTIAAQETPIEIVNGNISFISSPAPYGSPYTFTNFAFRSNIGASLPTDTRSDAAMTFLPNRGTSGAKQILTVSSGVRGTVYTCQGFLAHQNQPLSTRLEMTFADFRTPKFSKMPPTQQNESIEIIVPFTMTGRLSCMGDEGQLSSTYLVNGSGNALLKFVRVPSYFNKIYLVRASYSFGSTAPTKQEAPVKNNPINFMEASVENLFLF